MLSKLKNNLITFFVIRQENKLIRWGNYINKQYRVWKFYEDAYKENIPGEIIEFSFVPESSSDL